MCLLGGSVTTQTDVGCRSGDKCTICDEMGANQILEVLELWMFNLCRAK